MAETKRDQYIRLRTSGLSKEEALKAVNRSTSKSVASGLNTVFGGGTIGEAIGTQIAKLAVPKENRQFLPKGPSLKNIAGDAVSSGLTFIPAGKAFQGASKLGKVVRGIGIGGAVGAAEAVENDQNVVSGAVGGGVVGGAIPVALDGVSLATRFIGSVSKNTAGVVTGRGPDVIETVLRNPKLAKQGLDGDTTKVLRELSTTVRTEVSALQKAANKQYASDLAKLPQKELSLKAGDYSLLSSLKNTFGRFDIKVDGNKFDFSESPFRSSEERVLREVFDVMDNWTDTTPRGLNRLAIKIGNFEKAGEQSKALNSVIRSTKKDVRSFVGKQVPEVGDLNRRFAESQDFLDALKATLTSKDPSSGEKGVMLTARRISTLFNANKELARELVEALERKRNINILPVEAGRQLATGPTRAASSIGDKFGALLQSVIPPKVVGEIVRKTGLAQQKVTPVIDALNNIEPTARVLLIRVLSDSSEQTEEN